MPTQLAVALVLALALPASAAAAPLPVAKQPLKVSTVVRRGNLSLDGVPEVPERLRERMNQYLNVRNAFFADWDDVGEGMLVLTRLGDAMQVHHVARPLGAREQLTFYREPVADVSWVRGSKDRALLVKMDRGGAERYQLYRVDLDQGRTALLTDGKSRVESVRWSARGGLFAYSSNERNGRDVDLYERQARPGAGKRLLEVRGNWAPLDFSPDARQLLALEYLSANETYLHVVERASGKLTALTPRDGKRVARPAALWDKDGTGIYLTSDHAGEFTQLYHFKLASRALTPLSRTIPWNVESLELSPDGRTLVFAVNEAGLSRVYALDTRSRRARRLPLPDGIVLSLGFSRRRPELLGLSLMPTNGPSDAFSFDLRRGKLERWTRSEVGGLDTTRLVTAELIRYPTFDSVDGKPREISAFYYRPRGRGPHPVIISIHGGPEGQFRPTFDPALQYWALELGAAVLGPNVRGSDGYGKSFLLLDNGMKREDSVRDIGALLDWIAKRPELDARRVMVVGGSYGGYMVLASLVHFGKRLRGGVDVVGISNFVTFLQNTQSYRRELRRAEYGDERKPEMRAFLQRISPLTSARRIVSPLLVIQGANDPRVPASESDQLVRAVRAGGQRVWYLLAHDEGHGFRKKPNRDLSSLLTALFLEQHLAARPAAR
jgi:dipeptidyl aminopeptidase/acylaminoacyl peptidase